MQKSWKTSERRDAIARFKAGASTEELATVFNRSKGSIIMMLFRANVKRNPRWSEEDNMNMIQLFLEGKTDRETGKAIGRTKDSVRQQRRYLKENGLWTINGPTKK